MTIKVFLCKPYLFQQHLLVLIISQVTVNAIDSSLYIVFGWSKLFFPIGIIRFKLGPIVFHLFFQFIDFSFTAIVPGEHHGGIPIGERHAVAGNPHNGGNHFIAVYGFDSKQIFDKCVLQGCTFCFRAVFHAIPISNHSVFHGCTIVRVGTSGNHKDAHYEHQKVINLLHNCMRE